MAKATRKEATYIYKHTGINEWEMVHELVDCAVSTIKDALIQASLEYSSKIVGTISDNQWGEIEITVFCSKNPRIMPHLVEIDNTIYNAEYAVRVLAAYIYSVNLQRAYSRLAS